MGGSTNMTHIQFDYSKVLDKFVAPHEVDYMQAQVSAADELLRKGTGAGSDFTHVCRCFIIYPFFQK